MFALGKLGAVGAKSVAGDPTGWVLQADGLKATVDFDFVNNIALSGGTVAAPATKLTVTRASTGYADDTSGNWTSFATNAPRITNKGLLVEEARTNGVRNNSMQGAVAGTPGTLPTNWSYISPPATTQIVGVGTQNGIDYIDIRFAGGAALTFYLQFDSGMAMSASQPYSTSMWLALAGGSLTNFGATPLVMLMQTNIGNLTTSISTIDATLSRYTGTVTSQAGAVSTNFILQFNATGGAFDLTIRIGWPQLEQGAWATSPIRTTSAAATRAADLVSITTYPALSSTQATLYAQVIPFSFYNGPTMVEYNDGTANNLVKIYSDGRTVGILTSGGVNQVAGGSVNTVAANARGKMAFATVSGSQGFVLNGGSVASLAVATGIPTMTQFVLGNELGGNILNGYLERAAVWQNNRISNAGLVSLTQ